MDEDKLLSPKQLAQYLGINRNTVYNWIRRNQLPVPYTKTHSRLIRFKKIDVEKWLKRSTVSIPSSNPFFKGVK